LDLARAVYLGNESTEEESRIPESNYRTVRKHSFSGKLIASIEGVFRGVFHSTKSSGESFRTFPWATAYGTYFPVRKTISRTIHLLAWNFSVTSRFKSQI